MDTIVPKLPKLNKAKKIIDTKHKQEKDKYRKNSAWWRKKSKQEHSGSRIERGLRLLDHEYYGPTSDSSKKVKNETKRHKSRDR